MEATPQGTVTARKTSAKGQSSTEVKKQVTEIVTRNIQENLPYQDSITIGTPAKGGELKVYYDAGNIDQGREKLRNAVMLRAVAREYQQMHETGADSAAFAKKFEEEDEQRGVD